VQSVVHFNIQILIFLALLPKLQKGLLQNFVCSSPGLN